MKFGKAFTADLNEAFAYFKEKQLQAVGGNEQAKKQIEKLTLDKWVATLLRKPVYELLGEKRVEQDE